MVPDAKLLKKLAMSSVVFEPGEYTIRHIFRWYSKTFSTPLHFVETLPLEEVLTHFFESQYEEMSEDDRHAEIIKILMTEEELAEACRKEDAEDAEAWEFGREAELLEKQEAAKAKAKPPEEAPPVAVDPITARINKLHEQLKAPQVGFTDPLPEGIHLSFEDLDEPGFGPNKKPKPG